MKNSIKIVATISALLVLSGCSTSGQNSQSEASAGNQNSGFLKACLWFKNQDGYANMAESFYDENRATTLASWTDGLEGSDRTELEDFFEPYNEKWARGLVIDMAFDDSAKESTEWINLQIKCLENNVEIEFPNRPY